MKRTNIETVSQTQFLAQARLLEWQFDVLVELMRTGDGTFERADALRAFDRAGWFSNITDERERQLALTEYGQHVLTALTRAKLIAHIVKPDFTPNRLLLTRREIGSLTGLGKFFAQRGHAIRRTYLFLWCMVYWAAYQKRRWLWLISASQLVAWTIIGWRAASRLD